MHFLSGIGFQGDYLSTTKGMEECEAILTVVLIMRTVKYFISKWVLQF